jgi:exonuclease III
MSDTVDLLSWNVRGLNDVDRQATVNEIISASSCHIVCLQETKLDVVDQYTASFLGGFRLKSFAQRPAIGTRGGILLLWDDDTVLVTDVVASGFASPLWSLSDNRGSPSSLPPCTALPSTPAKTTSSTS